MISRQWDAVSWPIVLAVFCLIATAIAIYIVYEKAPLFGALLIAMGATAAALFFVVGWVQSRT